MSEALALQSDDSAASALSLAPANTASHRAFTGVLHPACWSCTIHRRIAYEHHEPDSLLLLMNSEYLRSSISLTHSKVPSESGNL